MVLTFEFRLKLYDEWVKTPKISTVRKVLNENGINTRMTGRGFISSLHEKFKRNRPSRASNTTFGVNASSFKTNKDDDEFLLSTGVFAKGRNGITFSNEFINEVSLTYPNVSIEDKLKERGIDPDIVGYQRIYILKKKLSNTSFLTKEKSYYSDEVKIKYDNHPYVAKITEAYYKTPSTTDYNGVYRGKYIDFEAKETKNKTSFPLFMIHPHQIKHLKKVVFHGGIGFFIIRFNYHNETYLVDSKMLIDKIENIDKSSIPYTWFQNHGTLIQEGLYPRLAYLKVLDELYFKEDK